MGSVIHTAIIVVGWNEDDANAARAQAVKIFGESGVTEAKETTVNGYGSFMVISAGSKWGWPSARAHQDKRDEFVSWLRHNNLFHCEWCEVAFGQEWNEEGVTRTGSEPELSKFGLSVREPE